MLLNFDKKQLISVLNDFHNITGINITLLDAEKNRIGENEGDAPEFCKTIHQLKCGKQRCCASDRRLLEKCAQSKHLEMHTCHAGLTDMAIPIISDHEVIAFILLGQIKNDASFEEIESNFADLDCNKKILEKSYNSLIYFDKNHINSISNIALMLTEHILFNNMLKPNFDIHIQKSIEFINNNLNSNITVSDICGAVNISKSVLYKSFKKHLNTSPNQYVNEKKIAVAKKLIDTSDMSVKEIAAYLGFTNTTYFYKLFKKQVGKTPIQFKNQVK